MCWKDTECSLWTYCEYVSWDEHRTVFVIKEDLRKWNYLRKKGWDLAVKCFRPCTAALIAEAGVEQRDESGRSRYRLCIRNQTMTETNSGIKCVHCDQSINCDQSLYIITKMKARSASCHSTIDNNISITIIWKYFTAQNKLPRLFMSLNSQIWT